ncbi:hypothetical protein [Rhodovulum sulfidophilum]|uniref:hypothetical protein n=1 Tax=Rhodovulum sulfidophilum TaxID=35806 RepID=UPI001389F099|nr:hypothetical protein [Rhodovulum sulfidophilum]NDK36492.1 hypothetical protein [Rhodovulum sulfidophilum]
MGFEEIRAHVTGVEYLSRPGTSITLILRGECDCGLFDKIRNSKYVETACRIERFFNITFNQKIRELYTPHSAGANSSAEHVIVEHTSLAPVYPLNLATFRLSVVGEWFRRAFQFLGDNVQTRFWVQDSARQVDLVKSQLRLGGYTSTKTAFGKGDHTVGLIFAEALLIEDGASKRKARTAATRLFPLGSSGLRRPEYGNWILDVIAGWRSTFGTAGIHVDRFDREADILESIEYEAALEAARNKSDNAIALPTSTIAPGNMTYLEWSVIYYCFLLQGGDRVVSVASARQRAILEAARDYACFVVGKPKEVLQVVSVGDVFCDGELDSVRAGRFHLVDNLDFYSQRNVQWLTTRYLTARPSTNLKLRFPIEERGETDAVEWERTDEIVYACMLLDSLPLIVRDCTHTGDFAPLTRWTANAKACRSRLGVSAAELSRDLASACDLFDPFPT